MSIRTIISEAQQAFLKNNTGLKNKVHQECKSIFHKLSESEKEDTSLMIALASIMVWCEDWDTAWDVQKTFFKDIKNTKRHHTKVEDYLYLCFILDTDDEMELFSYYGWLERYFQNAYDVIKCINGEYPKYYYEDDSERLAGIEKFKTLKKKYATNM